MASWGLLGGLGQGLQQAGDNMYEQAKLQRIQEWKDQALQQQNAREDRIRAEDMQLASQAAQSDREWEREKLTLQHQNAKEIAAQKERSMSGRYKASTWTDPETNMPVQRVLDTWTGNWADQGGGGAGAPTPSLTPEMEAEIEQRVDDEVSARTGGLFGFFGKDSKDAFADYNGSESVFRQRYAEQLRQQYLSGVTPEQQAANVPPPREVPADAVTLPGQAAKDEPQAATKQVAMPQPQEFSPVASVGLLNNSAAGASGQNWQEKNRAFQVSKPAVEAVLRTLDLPSGSSAGGFTQEQLEAARPYLQPYQIQAAEQYLRRNGGGR